MLVAIVCAPVPLPDSFRLQNGGHVYVSIFEYCVGKEITTNINWIVCS